MSSRSEALITPSVIKWAREKAKLSIEEAASKIRRPPEDIKNWENGSLKPSIAQARNAARVYRRPLAMFYLPEPPSDFSTLRDFRSLPGQELRKYSPELTLLIRNTRYRQEWMKEYLVKEGADRLAFVGSSSIKDDPRDVAKSIREIIDISIKEQKKCKTPYDYLLLWLKKSESSGIFVFRQRQIRLKEARGFILSNEIAPFIFINSDDSKAGQLFTLVHELAHLWIDKSGVSNIESSGSSVDEDAKQTEIFCNEVAAQTLLEQNAFKEEWRLQNPDLNIRERIYKTAGIFNVSEEVVARRLLELDVISKSLYSELREYYQKRWRDYKKREKRRFSKSKGGPSYYVITLSQNGYAFTETVVGAYAGGSISGRDASALLNVKTNNIHKLGQTAGIFINE